MNNLLKKNIALLFILALFLYAFVVFDTNFHGPDEPLYYAYTESLVLDGDLNIVDQLSFEEHPYYFPEGKILISKTYNSPDYHNHGGVIFWAPFYIYGKVIKETAAKFNFPGLLPISGTDSSKLAMSFSTVLFSILTVLLSFLFCKNFFSNGVSISASLIIIFGTPFFYFSLFQVANAQILAALFSILSIWFFIYIINKDEKFWFLYGLFFSFCLIIKVDIWFQSFFILTLFLVLLILKKIHWRLGVYFLIGLIPGNILKIINDYLKYGTFHIGELGLFNRFKDFYFFEQLFSHYRGFFYTSPIFYLCVLGLILLLFDIFKNSKVSSGNIMQKIIIFCISVSLIIKVFILSFRCAWGGGTPGARLLLTEYPVFILLYAYALEKQKKLILRVAIYLASILFIFWNWLIIAEFISQLDFKYILGAPPLLKRLFALKYINTELFSIKDISFKLYCLPLIFIIFPAIAYFTQSFKEINISFSNLEVKNSNKLSKIFILSIIYIYISNLANRRVQNSHLIISYVSV
ncbi:MAG: glycosyltransferase family 39 protein [Candidatus Omnitrophica bacterium]|nr:glycosyltransferase family 39 protein [Candidatus Omnitrophota bacterium]